MKRISIIVVFLIVILFPSFCKCDTLYISDNRMLLNEFLLYINNIDSISTPNNHFKGYLIIEIDPNIEFKDSGTYQCKIYWIKNAKDYENNKNYYWYTPMIAVSLNNYLENGLNDNISKFAEFYFAFNNATGGEYNSPFFDLKGLLYSKLLNFANVWYFKGKYLIIYECDLSAAEMYFTYDTNFDGIKGVYHFKTLIPIGKFINFNQITESNAYKYGLEKSNIIYKTFNVKN